MSSFENQSQRGNCHHTCSLLSPDRTTKSRFRMQSSEIWSKKRIGKMEESWNSRRKVWNKKKIKEQQIREPSGGGGRNCFETSFFWEKSSFEVCWHFGVNFEHYYFFPCDNSINKYRSFFVCVLIFHSFFSPFTLSQALSSLEFLCLILNCCWGIVSMDV